jgi:excisionase family DNA binding protein
LGDLVNITMMLTDDQLDELAQRVAEILACREPEPDLLTLDQAASMAGVSPRTISNWISAGRLERHGVARKPLVARAELLALLEPADTSQTNSLSTRIRPRRRQGDGHFVALAKGGGLQ